MKSISVASPIPLLICLCTGLLFDTLGVFRCTLLCAVLHEAGHIAAYCVLLHRVPHLQASVQGITLRVPQCVSRHTELLITLCGPAMNLLLFACGALYSVWHPCVAGYLFAGVNLSVGLFNLLPVGALDGARLITTVLPPRAAFVLRTAGALATAAAALAACALQWVRPYALAFTLYVLWKCCAEN